MTAPRGLTAGTEALFAAPLKTPAETATPWVVSAGPTTSSGRESGPENRLEKPLLGDADLIIVVYGTPGPQGSKTVKGTRRTKTGKLIANLVESSAKVKPWREAVAAAARDAMEVGARVVPVHRMPLDGPLAASIVFTVRDQPASKPKWWPANQPWSKHLRWRPASTPDLSKLLRSTEDALTGVAWKDDARVVSYRRLEKFYAGHPAEDVLDSAGAVIRIWTIGGNS